MNTGQGGEFDWDEHNLTHLSRHKITPAEFEESMRNNRLFMDVEDESGEERWYVAGITNGLRVLVLVFTYRGSWCADGFRTSWESEWRIVGTKGSLTWDGFDELHAEAATKVREGLFDKVEPIDVPPLDSADRIGGHLGIIQDFVASIRDGTLPETNGADNIKSLAMVFGAIESAERGRRVPITL